MGKLIIKGNQATSIHNGGSGFLIHAGKNSEVVMEDNIAVDVSDGGAGFRYIDVEQQEIMRFLRSYDGGAVAFREAVQKHMAEKQYSPEALVYKAKETSRFKEWAKDKGFDAASFAIAATQFVRELMS